VQYVSGLLQNHDEGLHTESRSDIWKKYTCIKFQYTHNIPRREWHRPDDPSADQVGFAIMLIIALDLMQIYTCSILPARNG
jgi:hypothetical protein